MRPIKQTAVISTHALIYFSPLSTSFVAASMLTLTHFSRDAFLFVSACMLAYSYRGSDKVALGPYWKRRFMAVGLVYLVWTVIYFPIAAAKNSPTFPFLKIPGSAVFSYAGLHNFLFNLGTGYYHLYFLLVLLEFYVLFPYIFLFLKRSRGPVCRWSSDRSYGRSSFPSSFAATGLASSCRPRSRRDWCSRIRCICSAAWSCAFYLESFHDWVVRHRKGILITTVLVAAVPLVMDYVATHGTRLSGVSCPGRTPSPPSSSPTTSRPSCVSICSVCIWSVRSEAPAPEPSPRQVLRRRTASTSPRYLDHYRGALGSALQSVPPGAVDSADAECARSHLRLGWLFSALIARTPWPVPWWGEPRCRGERCGLIPRRPSRPDFGEGPLNLTDQ